MQIGETETVKKLVFHCYKVASSKLCNTVFISVIDFPAVQ